MHQGLDYWVERLSKENLPILTNTARVIGAMSAQDGGSVAALTQAILQDSAMTSRVLKLSNSTYYSPTRRQIQSVSRAIIFLGFESIRSIALSHVLLETMKQGLGRERAQHEMALAFQAATQAKAFASTQNDKSLEEVFIAALLYRLGHIAFWCFSKEEAERMEAALGTEGYTQDRAEMEVLGFRLDELTSKLNEEWRLSPLLGRVLAEKSNPSRQAKTIILAHELARSSNKGWWTIEMERIIGRISELLELPIDKVMEMAGKNAESAAEVARACGAAEINRFLPLPDEAAEVFSTEEPDHPDARKEPFPEPDPQLQLSILSDISGLFTEGQIDLDVLISMVLEGILRGIGMDRALFAILTPDRSLLKARHALGWKAQAFREQFVFNMLSPTQNLFAGVLEKKEAIWFTSDPQGEMSSLLTPEIVDVTGEPPFFIMPIVVNNKTIGMIYADRKRSKCDMDEASFSSFRLFGQQCNIGLSLLSRKIA